MSVAVNCPQCGRTLKLPDSRMLGRKGKCPKCGHAFILEAAEPPEAKVEIAPEIAPAKPKPQPERIERPVEPEPEPTNPFANLTIEAPKPPPKEPEPEFEFQIPSVANTSSPPTEFPTEFPSAFPTFEPVEAPRVSRSPQRKLPARQNSRTYLIVGIIAAVAIGALGLGAMLLFKSSTPSTVATNPAAQPQSELKTETQQTENNGTDSSGPDYAGMGAPTNGQPIELRYIPFGTELVIHLRPAQLWSDSPLFAELRECIPPLDRSLQNLIRDLCKADAKQIDELLICLIPGNRSNAPEIAAVAHFTDELDQSEFDKRFGKRNPGYEQQISVQGDRACLMIDSKSIAVCPKSQIDEMIQAIDEPHPSNQIDPLLPATDRDRHVTVIAMPLTLRLYENWFPENVRPLLNAVVNWFGDRVEAVAWSIHLTPELFDSDLVVREKAGISAKSKDDVARRLPTLAENLISLIERMDPKERGPRTIIGRFPAMVEVFSMATTIQRSPHEIRLTTPLPDRAAPNLFLAGYLAWEESTRTDFSKSSPGPKDLTSLPDTIAERLNKKVDVDFRGTPFSEAFAFLSQEIGTPIEIDGDALKAGGFTKNLKQTFQMDGVPAKDVVQRIFEESKGISDNPEKSLVMVVNEPQKRIVITTKKMQK